MSREIYLPDSGLVSGDNAARNILFPDGVLFGEVSASGSGTISPTPFNSGESFVGPVIASQSSDPILPVPFNSGESFVGPNVADGFIRPQGFNSGESFGSHDILGATSIRPVPFNSGESFIPLSSTGTGTGSPNITLTGGGLTTFYGRRSPIPPQDLPPIPRYGTGLSTPVFWHWLELLALRVREPGQIPWNTLIKTDVKIIEIADENRQHNDLAGIQGGDPGDRHHWKESEKHDNEIWRWMIMVG